METLPFEGLLSASELLWPSPNKASPRSPAKEHQSGSWAGKQNVHFVEPRSWSLLLGWKTGTFILQLFHDNQNSAVPGEQLTMQ